MHQGRVPDRTQPDARVPLRLVPHVQRRYLPAVPTPLFGRDQALAELKEQLTQPYTRLLTLVGPPGVGKTRLALAAAEAVADGFPQGVVFVDLTPLRDPKLVLAGVAQAVGLRQQGRQSPADQLGEYVRDATMLVVLDNFEHLLEAADDLARLLAHAPGLKAVATSRAALHVRWEKVYAVPPLQLPERAALGRNDVSVLSSPAVQLFADRARACLPSFTLDDASVSAVAEVCARLDGLPLAIELAAGRSVLFAPDEILARLKPRLDLLADGPRDAAARHRTLREAIQWSYELMSADEQAVFRRLSVYVGGFTVDAAEALMADLEGEQSTLDSLTSLVRKSLVRVDEAPVSAAGGALPARFRPGRRFRLLETIREYAWERLEAAGEARAAQRRAADYLLALVEEGYALVFGPEQRTWLDRLEQEYDNLRQALRWSLDAGDYERALRLAGALHWFWYASGYLAEGARWVQEALARGITAPASARAVALRASGALTLNQGDFKGAHSQLEAAVALNRGRGVDRSELAELAMSLGLLGVTCLAAGALEAAEAHVREALATYESLADEWGVATAKEVLGAIAAMRGDAAGAETLAGEALTVHRRLGGRENISRTLDVLGLAAFLRQDLATAAARFEESLALRRVVLNRTGTAATLSYVGMVAQAGAEYDRAVELYRECLALAHEVGDRATLTRCLGQVAALALERGADRMAVARLASAVARQRAALGLPTPPVQRAAAERFLSSLRAGLGPVGLGAAFVAGQVLSLSRAYQLGLSLLDSSGAAQPRAASVQPAVGPERLTRRETEVAALVAQGLTNRQIAEELVVAQRTVDTHVERILAKLGFSSRAQVAAWAAQQGLVPLRGK